MKIFEKYKVFISDTENFTKVSEKGAIQLLFDVKFLRKVFEGNWSLDSDNSSDDEIRVHQEKEEMFNQLLRVIKQKVII